MARAGWYPDPREDYGLEQFRWWNGNAWTAWLSDDADAPAPPGGGDPRTVAAVPASRDGRRHTGLVVLIGVLTVVALVAALTVFGDRRLAATPIAGASTAPTDYGTPQVREPDFALDGRTVVLFGEVRVEMPTSPWPEPRQTEMAPFDSLYYSQQTVHRGWSGTVVTGYLDADTAVAGDLDATAERLQEALLEQWYSSATVSVQKVVDGRADGFDSAVTRRITLGIEKKDLPTTSESLDFVLVELSDGRFAAHVRDLPDDMTAADKAAAPTIDQVAPAG